MQTKLKNHLSTSYKCYFAIGFILALAAFSAGCKKSSDTEVKTYDFSYSGNSFAYSKLAFKSTASGSNSFSWDFGDGTIATDSTPIHIYITNGSFTVTLVINNDTHHPISKKLVINSVAQQLGGGYGATSRDYYSQDTPWPVTSLLNYTDSGLYNFGIDYVSDTTLNVRYNYNRELITSLHLAGITDSTIMFYSDSRIVNVLNEKMVVVYNFSGNSISLYVIDSSASVPPAFTISYFQLNKVW